VALVKVSDGLSDQVHYLHCPESRLKGCQLATHSLVISLQRRYSCTTLCPEHQLPGSIRLTPSVLHKVCQVLGHN
jgi:hypothetical protein